MRKATLLLTLTTIFFMSELISGCAANANRTEADKIISDNGGMPVYVIEREIPGAGTLSPKELKAISEKSCGVLKEMGKVIKWMHSYVTDDKIYCVYSASDTNALIAHAKKGGFPINRISPVRSMISPATATE